MPLSSNQTLMEWNLLEDSKICVSKISSPIFCVFGEKLGKIYCEINDNRPSTFRCRCRDTSCGNGLLRDAHRRQRPITMRHNYSPPSSWTAFAAGPSILCQRSCLHTCVCFQPLDVRLALILHAPTYIHRIWMLFFQYLECTPSKVLSIVRFRVFYWLVHAGMGCDLKTW